MKLAQVQGYFLRIEKNKKKVFTEKCLQGVKDQLKDNQVFLTLEHNHEAVGEIVACSIDRTGLIGTFVLYSDHPLFFRIVTGIASNIFKGFSIKYDIKKIKEVRGVDHVEKIVIRNIGLTKRPNNFRCAINANSYDRILEILTENLRGLGDGNEI